ncbi:hypothetical protein GCM10010266_32790 [Streptomyces griseomycini]|uniref:hypothetical protein n=1 Tax=Streptomyces griseomycini TaxID=66895 RepID=UPI001876532A|nr:hypothetical protein [Streptomyces griseomycini]GGQ06706.1 hypothetical protein GCM10010266_32790 [Streptomyces griseomycini]
MRRTITAVLGTLAVSAASVGLWAVPASASDVHQGSDWATHAYDGTWFDYCDGEDDNHSVWGGYYTTSSSAYQTSSPVNGYCGTEFVDGVLTNLRMVEDNPASSTNYYGAWHGYPVAGS